MDFLFFTCIFLELWYNNVSRWYPKPSERKEEIWRLIFLLFFCVHTIINIFYQYESSIGMGIKKELKESEGKSNLSKVL